MMAPMHWKENAVNIHKPVTFHALHSVLTDGIKVPWPLYIFKSHSSSHGGLLFLSSPPLAVTPQKWLDSSVSLIRQFGQK